MGAAIDPNWREHSIFPGPQEHVPVKRIVLNQLVPPEAKAKFLELRVRDQQKAFDMYKNVRVLHRMLL